MLTPKTIDICTAAGIKVNTWTVGRAACGRTVRTMEPSIDINATMPRVDIAAFEAAAVIAATDPNYPAAFVVEDIDNHHKGLGRRGKRAMAVWNILVGVRGEEAAAAVLAGCLI